MPPPISYMQTAELYRKYFRIMRARADRVVDTHADPFSEIIFKESVVWKQNQILCPYFLNFQSQFFSSFFFKKFRPVSILKTYALVMYEIVCFDNLKKARQIR